MNSKRPPKKAVYEAARALIDTQPMNVPFDDEALSAFSLLTGTALSMAIRRRNPAFPSDPRHVHVLAYGWDEPQEWSWRKAIDAAYARDPAEHRRTLQLQEQLRAMRFAVRSDMREFRDAAEPQECSGCGATEDLTCDHAGTPFIRIACDFMAQRGLLPLKSQPGCGQVIASIDDESEWIAFHASRSSYELLCRSCNSAKGAR